MMTYDLSSQKTAASSTEGTVKHIHGLGHPVSARAGSLFEVVGTQLDVTERKRAEEERERLRQAQAISRT